MQFAEHTSWNQWQHRVRDVLDIPSGMALTQADLPRPWFLTPGGDELTDSEAEELLTAVRKKLIGTVGTSSAGTIVQQLKRLNAEDSLPLLYAMRHVARTDGSIGRYWPAFREHITGSSITLYDVQVRLAPELAQLWLRLYVHTSGALYYPREGKRNIKWPLVHAGLLPPDEEALWYFGKYLASQFGTTHEAVPLAGDDLDQFLLLLVRWLAEYQYGKGRLAQLLQKHDGTAEAIGEIAQRWLRTEWDRLLAGSPASKNTRPLLPRPRFVYDHTVGQIQLRLPSGKVPGRIRVAFRWNGGTWEPSPRYLPSDNTTEYDALHIWQPIPIWDHNATFTAGDTTFPLALSRSPVNTALVFDGETGQLTRQWRLGTSYYVLIPQQRFDYGAANRVFSQWTEIDPPQGSWHEFHLLAVETVELLPETTSILQHVHQLAQATERLGLPDFAHLWRPRLRLVGGDRLLSAGPVATFSATDRPYVETLGLWQQPLPLMTRDRAFPDAAPEILSISPSVHGAPVFVEAWPKIISDQTHAQHLALDGIASQDIDFTPPMPEVGLPRLTLALSLQFNGNANHNDTLTYHDLMHGTLTAQAWPNAQLRLVFHDQGPEHYIAITADADGKWCANWNDLGVRVSYQSPLTITLNWRNLLRSGLLFADGPFIARDDVQARCTHNAGAHHLSVTGTVTSCAGIRTGWLIVLGARPWADQLTELAFTIDHRGIFSAQIAINSYDPHWVIIGPTMPLREQHAQRPWQIVGLSDPPLVTSAVQADSRGTTWDEWLRLTPHLQECALPPQLYELVRSSLIYHLASELPDLLTTQPRWTTVNSTQTADRLAAFLRGGSKPSMALIGRRLFSATTLSPKPPFLTPQSLPALADALERGGEVGLCCIKSDGAHWLSGKLRVTLDRDKETCQLTIIASEPLGICAKCQLILPQYDLDHHHPITSGARSCTAEHPIFSAYGHGQAVPAHLAVSFIPDDPAVIVQTLLALCFRVAGGEAPPPASESWLRKLWVALSGGGEAAEPQAEFAVLRDAHQELWAFITAGAKAAQWPAPRRAQLVATATHYYEALKILYHWLRHELELPDATTQH